jgi:hypothetical protein
MEGRLVLTDLSLRRRTRDALRLGWPSLGSSSRDSLKLRATFLEGLLPDSALTGLVYRWVLRRESLLSGIAILESSFRDL